LALNHLQVYARALAQHPSDIRFFVVDARNFQNRSGYISGYGANRFADIQKSDEHKSVSLK
jgi:hypothetical protein